MTLLGYSVPETLTDDAGNSLKGVTVAVTGPSSYSGTAVSDSTSGILRLGPLPPGDYTITLNGRTAVVPVVASADDIVAAAAAAAPALSPVQTVAGRTGAVVLTKTDVGLANVDNTADASKPVSTAQAAADTAVGAAASAALTSAMAAEVTRTTGTYCPVARPLFSTFDLSLLERTA